jgi:hypothetical protein
MPEIAVSSNTAYDSSWKVWIRGESVFVESCEVDPEIRASSEVM